MLNYYRLNVIFALTITLGCIYEVFTTPLGVCLLFLWGGGVIRKKNPHMKYSLKARTLIYHDKPSYNMKPRSCLGLMLYEHDIILKCRLSSLDLITIFNWQYIVICVITFSISQRYHILCHLTFFWRLFGIYCQQYVLSAFRL